MNPYDKPADQLRAQFYAWERRGRGWDVYPHTVELEPPFRPFSGHFAYLPHRGDDGRTPGLLASLWGARRRDNLSVAEVEEEEPEPQPDFRRTPATELHVLLPGGFEQPKDGAENFLRAFQVCRRPVSFELIGQNSAVSLQLACGQVDTDNLVRQLQATAPGVALLDRSGFLADAWNVLPGVPLIVDLGLSEEFMRPLRGDRITALAHTVAALAGAGPGEIAILQVLFQPVQHPWAESILRAVQDRDGKPFFATGPELAAQAKQKVSKPLYACRIRLAARARSRGRSLELIRTTLSAFSQHAAVPAANELIALNQEGWEGEAQEADLLVRTTHRSGMIVNSEELGVLVHLPGRETIHLPLERMRVRTKAAPAAALGQGLTLGENVHLGARQKVALSPDQRMRHLYVVGASGTGKSTFLLNLIQQDVEAGHGVAVLDPHGDLADAVLSRVPEKRIADVVLFDPADEAFPIGFNILAAHSELERVLLSSDLVAVFRRLSTSWGDQMNSVFANAILAFLESSTGGTLVDLRHFLVDPKFRASFLATVQDPEIVYYWQKEFPLLKGNPQAPILTRLDAFLRPKLVRNMVGQRSNRLDFRSIMDEGKIVLAKLSHGAIGEENSYLLGALLVAKLHQTALSRQEQEVRERRDFFLYADEFQHFATPSMASLLAGVRKYRLGLTLAHQELRQLGGRTDEVASAALTNAATRVVFRVGDADVKSLADGFADFEARDLQNLGVGEAIVRIERSDADFNLKVPNVPPVDEAEARVRRSAVREASRGRYATPLEELAVAPTQLLPDPEPAVEVTPERPKVFIPTVAVPSPALPPAPAVTVPSSPGRGGQQHKYLQTLFKRFGEDRGFRATIEQAVLDGHGSVDVALEREGVRVAVEITVTTPTAHEIDNISKCLAAGFDHVVLVALDKTAQKRLNTATRNHLPEEIHGRVRCTTPEEIPALLDELAIPQATHETVAGYKVSVQYGSPASAETKTRLQGVRDIIARSLRRQTPP